jgi:outer membrane protein assembly factor BamB
MRALDWDTLEDAWPTRVGADNVSRYTTASPPLYSSSEVGLSSPAVVNDVVFMSTNKTALYAFDAATGLCLWTASDLPTGRFALGPAIYSNYVVMGAGRNLYIFKLPST